MSNKHELKIESKFFQLVVSGKKTFEIRKNDRQFSVGDWILLHETISDRDSFTAYKKTGRFYITKITDVFTEVNYGLQKGYAILSLAPDGAIAQ